MDKDDTLIAIDGGNGETEGTITGDLIEETVPVNPPGIATTGTSSEREGNNLALFIEKVQLVSAVIPLTTNPVAFGAALCNLVTSGFCGLLLLAVVNIIPTASIAIGLIYWDKDDNCSAGYIALFLVIGGIAHLVQGVALSVLKHFETQQEQDGNNAPSSGHIYAREFNNFLRIFIFGWLIATCYVTYSLHSHVDYNKETAAPEDYCNRTLYLFTFWVILAHFIVLGILVGICCTVLLTVICKRGLRCV